MKKPPHLEWYPTGFGREVGSPSIRYLITAGALAAVVAGCESPTAPTPPTISPDTGIPQVAGTYAGDLTMTVTGHRDETQPDPVRSRGHMRVTAEQVEWTVTLSATLTLARRAHQRALGSILRRHRPARRVPGTAAGGLRGP